MNFVKDGLVLLAAMCLFVPLFKRFKLGAILGYLAAGVLIGPHATGLIERGEDVLDVSELGVVFFLFLVGIELEPKRLWELRRAVFGLGNIQLVATAALIMLALLPFGIAPGAAAIAGIGLALSSTAIAMQLLTERGEVHSPAGRDAFAILLYQDVAVIPVLAIIPALGGGNLNVSITGALLAFGKVLAAVALIVFGGRHVTRPLFRAIAAARAHEVSVAVALLIVIGAGALMTQVGLSMGMGAFLAGVLLADSEYRHELEANVEPFKGLLLGLFFMAIGMTANVALFLEKPLVIAGGVVGLLAVKTLVLLVMGRFVKWHPRSRALVSVAMSQGGEFAFVLFSVAAGARVMSADLQETLVIIVSTSMAATPLAMIAVDRLLKALAKNAPQREFDDLADAHHPIIIAGFGRYGQVVARVLGSAGHKFTALEVSPEQVDFIRKWGNKVFYGDASRLDLLRAAKADEASAFVLAVDDVQASVRIAQVVKKNFPSLPIYARARNRQHAYALWDAGVTLLNRETLFSALKMAEEVLVGLGDEREDAAEIVDNFRRIDEEILTRQYAAGHADEKTLMQSSKQIRAELEQVLEAESAKLQAKRVARRTAKKDAGSAPTDPPPPPATTTTT